MTYVARWRWLLLRGVVADRKALSEVGGIVAPRLTRPSPHVRWLRGGRAFTRLPREFYCRQETSSAAAAAAVGWRLDRTDRSCIRQTSRHGTAQLVMPQSAYDYDQELRLAAACTRAGPSSRQRRRFNYTQTG